MTLNGAESRLVEVVQVRCGGAAAKKLRRKL